MGDLRYISYTWGFLSAWGGFGQMGRFWTNRGGFGQLHFSHLSIVQNRPRLSKSAPQLSKSAPQLSKSAPAIVQNRPYICPKVPLFVQNRPVCPKPPHLSNSAPSRKKPLWSLPDITTAKALPKTAHFLLSSLNSMAESAVLRQW